MVHGLPALFDAVFDETHAAQLTRNKNAGDVGFKILIDVREVHTPLFRADPEGDRFDRTCVKTGSVAYAMGGIDQGGPAIADTEDVLFGTCLQTGPALDAGIGIYDRMQGNRFMHPCLHRQGDFFVNALALLFLLSEINEQNHGHQQSCQTVNQ